MCKQKKGIVEIWERPVVWPGSSRLENERDPSTRRPHVLMRRKREGVSNTRGPSVVTYTMCKEGHGVLDMSAIPGDEEGEPSTQPQPLPSRPEDFWLV